ncbi:unnamed protein product [Durusdinium trenchii]|uniref:Uncharacterized protein n=1 Tax=Durusdinium trenchii TaxID=1381693 RepID=A0ABP0KNS3_9DINO
MVKMRTWLKGLVKGTSEEVKSGTAQRASSAAGRERREPRETRDEAMMACTTLLNFSCGSQASPLFRPLGGSCSIIYEALERRPRSISGGASPAAALSAAAEFLQGAKARVVGRVYWG